jgi:phosphoglycerol transferase MdoB-like AlkP superfamily enzyme
MPEQNTRAGSGWTKSRYGFVLGVFLTLVFTFSALRLVLFLAFKPPVPIALVDVLKTFFLGLHRDLLVALLPSLPLLFWFAVVPQRMFAARWHRWLLTAGLFLFWLVQIFLLAAEYYFFEEFRSRYNTVAVDYLIYPHEVFTNIWEDYPVPVVVLVCAVFSFIWLAVARRIFLNMWQATVSAKWRWAWFLGATALALALGSTLSLKALDFSTERVLNEVANNGALSFFSALWTHNLDYAAFYKTMDRNQAYQRVRAMLQEPNTQFVGDGDNLRRRVAGDPAKPRLNVVILLEESLGSEFWGALGRKGGSRMPCMDRLANEEGLLFTHIYASGNRTVRGFEGVLSSFPPLPGEAIVKRDRSENVETIARILKRDGYQTLFLCGGRGIFDGMRSFALNNGYDRFIELKHFEHPAFATIWGVCDEDLFQRSITECRALAATGQPFFATALTVSNHKPYTYPPGRIPENPNEHRRRNAVKYADYALGQFFAAAKQESFWTNTIFVVVADHGARVYGSQRIPIQSYEIPLLIAGPAVVQAPARISSLGGSLDVAPTILGLIGRPYETLFFGRDLLRHPLDPGRAWLHHNRDIGLFRPPNMVVLGLRNTDEFYRGDPKSSDGMKRALDPTPSDLELEQDAMAVYQVADDLYMHRRYQIDP